MAQKKMIGKYDLYIFDWDGTLCAMGAILKLNEWAKKSLKTWNREEKLKAIAANRKKIRAELGVEETRNSFLASLFEFLSVFYKPRLRRGVVEMLEELNKKQKKVAILSNGNGSRILKELQKTGIMKYFSIVVSAKDIKAIKPDPRGIERIMKKMKVKRERTIYFGDMVDDMFAADLARVDSCAIADGFDSYPKLRSCEPTWIFRTIEELRKSL